MNRVRRLLRLISLLQSERTFTADQLARELGVSRRTFFRDLSLLALAGVSYHYDAERRTYSVDASFFLPSLNLTQDEVLAILMATRRFVSAQSLPNYSAAVQAARKIENSLPPDTQAFLRRMLRDIEVRLPPLVDAARVEQAFSKVHLALGERRKVRLEYDSYFEKHTIQTDVSPYGILFMNRAWYLVGHSSLHDQVRTFKLDRVTKVNPLKQRFGPDPDFDLDQYFGLAWGMVPEGKVHRVRLRFLPKVAGNVEEITWHKSQRFTANPDGSCTLEADVDGLGEITWWILGYGDQVIVENPPELRERIAQIALKMCELAGVSPSPAEA